MNIINIKYFKSAIISIALIGIVFCGSVYADDLTRPEYKIILDRKLTSIRYEKKGSSYFVPLRYVAEYYGAEVRWSKDDGIKIVYNAKEYIPNYHLTGSTAMINLWDIKTFLGLNSSFNDEFNIVSISREKNAWLSPEDIKGILPRYAGYTKEDLNWMAKIIHAEANGEPYEAKIAVGNVILNRKASPTYPDTIKNVIFDRKNGIQFSPTANGSIYNEPSAASFLAAVEVLEGKRNADGALFFINPRYAQSTWVSRNRKFAFTLKNHDFYY